MKDLLSTLCNLSEQLAPMDVDQLDKVMEVLTAQLPSLEKATLEWMRQIGNDNTNKRRTVRILCRI